MIPLSSMSPAPSPSNRSAPRAMTAIAGIILIAAGLCGCDPSTDSAPAPGGSPATGKVDSTAKTGAGRIHLVDRAAERGLDFVHTDGSSGQYYITETLASGVALFDYDGDGLLDIYFPTGRMLPPGEKASGEVAKAHATNALFRQEKDGRFVETTQEAGVPGTGFGVGCTVGDFDGDGHLDLYVCQDGPDVLYRNRGDGTFEDATAASGLRGEGFSAGATFFDLEGDGDLDLYVTRYCQVDYSKSGICSENGVPGYCPPGHYPAETDLLYRNEGGGKFVDVSETSGIHSSPAGRGMGVIATDLNGDGRLDLYVANDGSENFLLENRGEGKFVDRALELGVALDANGDHQGSMGLDIGDIDLDGQPEIVVTNYQKQANALYRRMGGEFFTDVSMPTRMASRSLPWVGWGAGIEDFDDDGYPDLFIANGHLEDQIHRKDQSSTYKQPNQLLLNQRDGTFVHHSEQSGPGLALIHSSRGAAFGDIDNDGDVDIVVANSRERPSLLLNESPGEKRWLGLHLIGARDRFALNARATVRTDSGTLTREVRSGASYISQNDLRLRFGLGTMQVQGVEITWPDGERQVIEDLPLNRYTTIEQGKSRSS